MSKPSIRLDQFQNNDFDRGASRGLEALWLVCQSVFFRPSIPWPSGLRASLLRFFGAKVGEGLVIRSGTEIKFPWKLEVGEHVWIGEDVRILNLDDVKIGSHVCLSQEAFLCTGSHDFSDATFPLRTAKIEIGAHSWIGARGFVGPGVVVGEDCFLTAGSILTRSLESGNRATGNPAKSVPTS